jgi:Trp operon repressor
MTDTNPGPIHHPLKHVYSLNHVWFQNLPKESQEIKKGMRPFITISRQGGAGAHTLAEAILKEMGKRQNQPFFQGWHIFDNELCHMLEQDAQLKVTMDSLLTEEYRSALDDLIHELIDGASPQYAIVKKMSRCIRTLALMGKAIIVGRGGACLTQDLGLGVHVRLVAPFQARVRHTMTLRQINEAEAKKLWKNGTTVVPN